MHFFHLLKFLNINATNNAKETPLHIAIKGGKDQSVAKLIEHNADPHITTPLKGISLSSLGLAVACGQIKCLDTLIEKGQCSLLEKVEGIGNLLHVAVHFKQIKMLRHLINTYPEIKPLMDEINEKGVTPLVYAAELDEIKAIRLLVNKGSSLDKVDNQGRAPIHHAAYNQKYDAVQAFINLGAKLSKADKFGNTPLAIVEKEKSEDALSTANLLRGILSSGNRFSLLPSSSPSFPKNFAFKGGGVKGTAYAGIVKAFEERKLLGLIEKISGSSAGAIVSGLIAFNYTAAEIEDILFNKNFTDFLDHPFTKKRLQEVLKDKLSSVGKTLSTLSDLYHNVVDPTKIMQTLWHTTGLCKGEELRKYIEQLNAKKVEEVTGEKIEYLTFGELSEFIRKGYPFKHLHVYGTKLGDKPAIVSFNSESIEYKDDIISDTICISATLPGVFQPRYRCIKHNGKRIVLENEGSFVDGGVLYNLPLEAFDKKKSKKGVTFPKFNKYTLGFNLVSSSTESDKRKEKVKVETVGDLLLGLTRTYYKAEALIRGLNSSNAKRIIDIDIGDVQTADFGLSDEQKKALVDSGYEAASKFLNSLPTTVSFNDLTLKYPLDYQDLYKNFCSVLENERILIAESLISIGIDIDQLVDSNHNTVTHYFSERENLQALNYIDSQGGSLNKKNSAENTPFLVAVLNGKLKAMGWHFEKHPECIDLMSDNKRIAMRVAIQGGHIEAMDWLIAKDPSFFDSDLLYYAIEKKQPLAIKWILNQLLLQELDLSKKELGDEKVEILVQALEQNSSIHILDLKRNNLAEKGGKALGKLLESNQCLTSINLERNNLGEESGVALGKGLKNHPTLLHLNLLGNKIGDKGGLEIVQSIGPQMKELILASNEITDVTLKKLVEVLKGNNSLTKLSLWGNKITFEAAKLLIEALKEIPTFQELYLHQNDIKENEITTLKALEIGFKLII